MAKHDNDLQYLAMWLHTAANDSGHALLVRKLISDALRGSREMYGLPGDDEPDHSDREIPTIISDFAAYWDDHDRLQRQDEESNKPRS
jgi:hypothetical protein